MMNITGRLLGPRGSTPLSLTLTLVLALSILLGACAPEPPPAASAPDAADVIGPPA